MSFYPDEEEFWKCPKHPSKRRRTGICHVCLRDRLITLCPNCAHRRPCACFVSSGRNSSFSLLTSGNAVVGRVSNLIENEPSFHRSISDGNHLLRSITAGDPISNNTKSTGSRRHLSFLSVFRNKEKPKEIDQNYCQTDNIMMTRSRSVYIPTVNNNKSSSEKSKGWYFPSPMKVFRQSKTSKVVQERSPLHIGNSLAL
ncbi:uncharacterized protein LOC124910100 [Impatiens glandulifera]|uniref:uncharacterized protein LOC124910100 n=1 Tax=Impatiens glandulifera TaxID=253017 RepID=UPI001FB11F83|nr:uncharacterized protein LOC124910100 [Impatiens glandulifera]